METNSLKVNVRFSPLRIILIVLLAASLLFVILLTFSYFADTAGGIREVTVSNLTSNGASISWVTESKSKGNVLFAKDNNWLPFYFERNGKTVVYDDRDTEQVADGSYSLIDSEDERITHHVTLRNLEPNTTYYFRVGNSNRYFQENVFSFTTTTVPDDVRVPDPVYGKIRNHMENEKNPEEGIIYYYVHNSTNTDDKSLVYSSVLNPTQGTWTGDLGLLFSLTGEFYNWKVDTHKLQVDVKTDVGYGTQSYTMDNYKPLPLLDVNVRYVTEE